MVCELHYTLQIEKNGKVPCLQSLKNFSFQDTILEKGFVDLIASFVSDPRAGQWPVIPSLTWSLLLSIPHPAWSDIYYHPALPSDADIDYPEIKMMAEEW